MAVSSEISTVKFGKAPPPPPPEPAPPSTVTIPLSPIKLKVAPVASAISIGVGESVKSISDSVILPPITSKHT